MLVSLIMLAYGWCGSARAKSRIALMDFEFVGEDPVLAAELARRMSPAGGSDELPPPAATVPFPFLNNSDFPEPEPEIDARKRWKPYHVPTDAHLHQLQLKIQKQSIYAVQYRMKEVDHIYRKYKGDPRFRIAYIFKKLDEWKFEMHKYYSLVSGKKGATPRNSGLTVYRAISYYSYHVRVDVDVTYTIDLLLELNDIAVAMAKSIPGSDALQAGIPKENIVMEEHMPGQFAEPEGYIPEGQEGDTGGRLPG